MNFGKYRDQVLKAHPLIHAITNYVTANDCANILYASGASPIMADAPEETAVITSGCDGLVINLGTPNMSRLAAMKNAGIRASELRHPVVFDPVGVGASPMRKEYASDFLRNIRFSVIRGNLSEIRSLAEGISESHGVDAADNGISADTAEAEAAALAERLSCTVVLSGKTDIVTDGKHSIRIENGHPMMSRITGTGDQLSCLIAAFVTAECEAALDGQPDIFRAAASAVMCMGIAGETGAATLNESEGNATLRNRIIDSIFRMDGDTIDRLARYHETSLEENR